MDVLADECKVTGHKQKQAPYLFPLKSWEWNLPRELNPNHGLTVTTVFCVEGDSMWVSGPAIRSNLQKNEYLLWSSLILCCLCVCGNVVFPLLNKFDFLSESFTRTWCSKPKTIKRRPAERFCFLLVSPRETGILQNRISFWIPPRALTSDVPWRGFPRAPCCCPGCPASLSLAPQLRGSSPPGAWGLWPAASPESCESLHSLLIHALQVWTCSQIIWAFPG